MYDAYVKLANGDEIRIDGLQCILRGSSSDESVKTFKENDFQTMVYYPGPTFTFVGSSSMLSVIGSKIEHVFFMKNQE